MTEPSPESDTDFPYSSSSLAFDFISHARCVHASPSRAYIWAMACRRKSERGRGVEFIAFSSEVSAGILSNNELPSYDSLSRVSEDLK